MINYANMGRFAAIARHEQLREAVSKNERPTGPDKFCKEIQEGIDSGQYKPEEFSLRKLFQALIPGGKEILESWDGTGQAISLSHADHVSLMEAGVTLSASFSNITGQIVYNKVLEGFNSEQFVFSQVVPTVQTQFNGEKIPGVSRLGNTFESIGEGQPYPYAGVGEDYIETPPTVKRGEIVALTKEAIFFDRTGLLLKRAQEVGEFYGINREIRLIDAVVDENVTAHRYKWKGTVYASFQATTPWVNIKSSNQLVDWTDLDGAELTRAAIVDPYTGLPITILGNDLIVPRQLRATAMQIIHAIEVRKGDGASSTAVTIGKSPIDTNYRLLSSQLLESRMATKTSWFIGDVARAVNYMQNWPMNVEQAPPNSHDEFTRDIAKQWKVSERGAAAVIEPRQMVKSTVA